MKKLLFVLFSLIILLLYPAHANAADYIDQSWQERAAYLKKCLSSGKPCAESMEAFSSRQKTLNVLGELTNVPPTATTPEEIYEGIKQGSIGQSTNFVATLYNNPPAQTSQYLAYMFNKAGLVPKTYAQGITYSRLLPILPIWKAFRDVAYMALTVFMLLIGIMIMFRRKVNPQTVASVENTIPNVIVTLILITFSFPIAALIIDFCYVLMAAGIGLIGGALKDPQVAVVQQDMATGGLWTLFRYTFWPVGQYIQNQWTDTLFGAGGAGGGAGIISLIGGSASFLGPVGWVIGPLAGSIVGGFFGTSAQNWDAGSVIISGLSPLLTIIICIVLLFSVFRIFFMLLASYIQIVVFVVLSPAILLLNAFPGQSTFSYWWKSIFSNMLTFVITAIMLYLASAITSQINQEPFWTAPFIIQGAGVPQMISGLIALGFVLLIPQVVQMVKGKFGAKPFANVGPGMILAPLSSGASSTMGIASQFHTASLGMGQLSGIASKVGIKVPGGKS